MAELAMSSPTKSKMRWCELITVNAGWLGVAMISGSMTPIILPVLVQQFVPPEVKNSFYGNLRFYGLMVALFMQPLAGLLSDRSSSRWGRRAPLMLTGALFSLVFLSLVAMSQGYWMLFVASILVQMAANTTHGALQGLIPDLVIESQRVQASGIKAIMELLPIIIVSFTVARFVDGGRLWLAILTVMGAQFLCVGISVLTVRERPLLTQAAPFPGREAGRLLLLTLAFTAVVQGLLAISRWIGASVSGSVITLLLTAGLAGAAAIVLSVVGGVWTSLWVGIGESVRRYPAYVWWVINRLLFMCGVVSVQGFALYFLQDVIQVGNPAGVTAQLMLVVGVLTLVSALLSGRLAKWFSRRTLLAMAGIGAAAGTVWLLFASGLVAIYVSGVLIGLSSGLFMAVNWALGTSLVPESESGRFLGMSNLAGAGAGAIGSGIGGPLADYFNAVQSGLGYQVTFGIFACCFVLSSLVVLKIAEPKQA